jgi:hypothetical protein
MTVANTLAYYDRELIAVVKSSTFHTPPVLTLFGRYELLAAIS